MLWAMRANRTTIAGIAVPDSALAREATEFHDATTRDVPRYMRPEVRLVQLGAQYDMLAMHLDLLSPEQRAGVLAARPVGGLQDGNRRGLHGGPARQPTNRFGTMK